MLLPPGGEEEGAELRQWFALYRSLFQVHNDTWAPYGSVEQLVCV